MIFKALKDIDGVVADILEHLLVVVSHPCCRDRLSFRVGPGVAEVKTQKDFHSLLFGNQRLCEHIFLVAEADVVSRV